MRVKTKEELSKLIVKKIIKFREKALRKMKSAYPGSRQSAFQPFEVSKSPITKDSLVSFPAFNSVISRSDVRSLNDKKADKFEYKEAKTTIAHITNFFFPRKKKKK